MKKIVSLSCLIFWSIVAHAQNPKISLLTFSPGNEAHTIFGHTAIRIQDAQKGTDIVYNYGIFEFDTPNFLLKFTKGDLDYRLGIEDYELMLMSYTPTQRSIVEQPFNFNSAQAKAFVGYLEHAYRPENRYYRYGFLQNNCSTKLRDLIFEKTEGVTYTPTATGNTYRYYLKNYTKSLPWFRFGINLALGSTIDNEIDTNELMFLPDYLSEEVKKASFNEQPLVMPSQKILSAPSASTSMWLLTPFIIFSLYFVVMVLTKSVFMSKLLTFALGATGAFLTALMLYSLHPEVHYNYNLLWCNPLYLFSFAFSFFPSKAFHKWLTVLLMLCLLAYIVICLLHIQGTLLGFFPLIICLFWINTKVLQRRSL